MSSDRFDQLRRIPLDAVLHQAGARRDRDDKSKWHTAKGTISITGWKFMNWNHGFGGGGAIDLAMHLNDAGFKDALDWLSRNFPLHHTFPSPPPLSRALKLPSPHPQNLPAVKRYLIQNRAIPPPMVDSLIASASLYADRRANAVFLLLGKENTPVGAELRGTGSISWHGMAPGSQKDRGFFSLHAPDSTMAILCESAIDAISCFIIHPSSRCISTAGARPNPKWLPSLLSEHRAVYCAFDADATGDAMAEQMTAIHPSVRRLRPTLHDWNDILKSFA